MPLRTLVIATCACVALATWTLGAQQGAPAALEDRTRALLKQVPLIDGHNDLPWAMREKAGYDFDKFDIGQPQPTLQTDIPRLRQGGVGAQFWSVYVPASLQGDKAVTATLEQIAAVYELARRYPDTFEIARSAADVDRIFKAGKIASMIGLEGGHSIDSSLGVLRMLRQLGAGYMTLTHSSNVPWADSSTDEPAAHSRFIVIAERRGRVSRAVPGDLWQLGMIPPTMFLAGYATRESRGGCSSPGSV